ncbi:DUF1048 domain-containing protein [Nocardia transvalensis]|uniref:DUF1048 domain-containing protein n=1 Tax=Nocardia transvalensis TaxID=37333 RepID=UPI001FECA5ED|nr:DUF1048 domain-containing protein [Nocardia transvalensis]
MPSLRRASRGPPRRVSGGGVEIKIHLGFIEETASEGQSVHESLGDDIQGFCAAIAGEKGARNFRDKWREQLNTHVARKLARLGA